MLAFVLVEKSVIRLYYCGALISCVLFESKFLWSYKIYPYGVLHQHRCACQITHRISILGNLSGNGSKLHEGTKLHEDKIARRQNCTKGQFCTENFLHKTTIFFITVFFIINFFFLSLFIFFISLLPLTLTLGQ